MFSDEVFGRVYDGPIKLATKSSKTAAETLQMPGLFDTVQDIEAKYALENQKEPVNHNPKEDCADSKVNDNGLKVDVVF